MDCHTCLNPQKKQGCLRRPSCCGEEAANDSDTLPLQFPPYYDYNPFGSFFYSQRTANRMLANLAASHTDKVVEMKKKAEVVIAAPTNKQASALARLEDSGGWSYHSDNVAKVQPRDVCVKFV